MVGRVQTARSSVQGNRPAAGSRQPGELYVNFPENQLGVINASQAPQDLLAITMFSTSATYPVGAYVMQGGVIYRCTTAVTSPGAFNPASWARDYVAKSGDTMTGQLNVNVASAVNSIVVAPTAAVGANILLNKAPGQNANLWGQQAGSSRWQLVLGSGTAEGSGNSGSDFQLNAYDNSGAVLGTYFSIARGSGTATFSQPSGGPGVYGLTVQPVTGASNVLLQSANGNVNLTFAKGVSGNINNIQGFTGAASNAANARWAIQLGNNTAEGTNNVGSDFDILNFSNSGVGIGVPFHIDRSSGYTILNGAGATAVPSPALANGSLSAALRLNKAGTGNISAIQGYNNGVLRWNMALGDTTAESGGGVGSNFIIQNCGDAGNVIATPLTINRSTQVTTFSVAIVNGPSDRRLKENIASLEGSLDKVKALQGVSFNFKATPDKPEIGLIAQDVEGVVPEVIQHYPRAGGDFLAIDYPKLVAVLIEAVKTLSARVEALEEAWAAAPINKE